MPHTRKELLSWAKDAWEKITGKHQQQEEVTIKCWIARDQDNCLRFFSEKPYKGLGYWKMPVPTICYHIHSYNFPSVQWSDPEPTPATITIKIKI